MSSKIINIVLDLETLSTEPNAAILQIGCCVPMFDRVHLPMNISPEMEVTIAYEDAMKADAFHKSKETMEWWETQNPEVRKIVFSGQDSYVTALDQIEFWMKSVKCKGADIAVWGNGAEFDNVILSHCFSAMGYTQPWSFRNNRCFRTIKNLFPISQSINQSGLKHTALADARYEAMILDQIKHTYMDMRWL